MGSRLRAGEDRDVRVDRYPAPPHIQEKAHVRSMAEYRALYRHSIENPSDFWGHQAEALDWFHPWHQVFDADYEAVDFAWFSGGRLNACHNCVDRHLETKGDQTAIIWAADEPGVYRHITYRELKHDVSRTPPVLLALPPTPSFTYIQTAHAYT